MIRKFVEKSISFSSSLYKNSFTIFALTSILKVLRHSRIYINKIIYELHATGTISKQLVQF